MRNEKVFSLDEVYNKIEKIKKEKREHMIISEASALELKMEQYNKYQNYLRTLRNYKNGGTINSPEVSPTIGNILWNDFEDIAWNDNTSMLF